MSKTLLQLIEIYADWYSFKIINNELFINIGSNQAFVTNNFDVILDFFDIKINLNNDYNKEDLFNAFISSKYFSFDIFNVDNIKSNDFDLNNILIQFNEFSKKTEKYYNYLNVHSQYTYSCQTDNPYFNESIKSSFKEDMILKTYLMLKKLSS